MAAVSVATTLCWSPLLEHIKNLAARAGPLVLVISPFASTDALAELLETGGQKRAVDVVVRWSEADLLTGVADLRLYPFLRAKGIRLFRHPRIHLKLYIFEGNVAFHASGNATGKGLGLGPAIEERSNIEVGCDVSIAPGDWQRIFELLDASELVDDSLYAQLVHYQEAHKRASTPAPPLVLRAPPPREYSVLSLPATPTPGVFADWYEDVDAIPSDARGRYEHDRELFRIPAGLNKSACTARVISAFRASPFVSDFVQFLRAERTLSFGKVKAWLQAHCSDKPVPYRWELSENTRILYDWLTEAHQEISWDRPAHSMVIRWGSATPGAPQRGPSRR